MSRSGGSSSSSSAPKEEDTYTKYLRYPKNAAFQVPGRDANKEMVWVPEDSDFGYAPAEVLSKDGKTFKVKLDSGEVRSIVEIS
jgi:hypothetical protein